MPGKTEKLVIGEDLALNREQWKRAITCSNPSIIGKEGCKLKVIMMI